MGVFWCWCSGSWHLRYSSWVFLSPTRAWALFLVMTYAEVRQASLWSQEKMPRSRVSSGCLGVATWIGRMPCSVGHSYSRAIWMIPVRVYCIQWYSCPCMICATTAHITHTVVHLQTSWHRLHILHMEILCHFVHQWWVLGYFPHRQLTVWSCAVFAWSGVFLDLVSAAGASLTIFASNSLSLPVSVWS